MERKLKRWMKNPFVLIALGLFLATTMLGGKLIAFGFETKSKLLGESA